MKAFYSKFTEKKFKTYAILVSLIGDLTIIGYLYTKFTDKQRYMEATKMAEMIMKQVPEYQGLVIPSGHWEGFYQVLVNTLLTGFSLVLILHAFIYFTYHRGAYSSFVYVRLVGWTAGIGCTLMGFNFLFHQDWPGAYFIIQGLAYLSVAKGLGHFRMEKKSAS